MESSQYWKLSIHPRSCVEWRHMPKGVTYKGPSNPLTFETAFTW